MTLTTVMNTMKIQEIEIQGCEIVLIVMIGMLLARIMLEKRVLVRVTLKEMVFNGAI